jgi:plastocyanin
MANIEVGQGMKRKGALCWQGGGKLPATPRIVTFIVVFPCLSCHEEDSGMCKLSVAAGLLLAITLNGHAFADSAASGSEAVTIAKHGAATATVVIQTIAVAVKETESKAQLAKFGEVYAFSPEFFAVYRDQPTRIELWNLQSDDRHDFVLSDAQHKMLMRTTLAPLAKKSLVFTFHHTGLYSFSCSIHQPEMSGQILVMPPPH